MTVIATNGGLLEIPLQRDCIILAPAQRLELWVDFSDHTVGEQLRLVKLPSAAPDGGAVFPVLTVQIEREESASETLPERLSTIALHNEAEAVNRRAPRDFTLAMERGMNWSINGRTFEMTDVVRDQIQI